MTLPAAGYFTDAARTNGEAKQAQDDILAFIKAPQANAGSVSAPGYSFSGDTNTGMWSPAADTLAWSTGGVEGMRLGSAGNIAVGGTVSSNVGIYSRKDVTGAASSYGVFESATIKSDVTTGAYLFRTSVTTEAASFTLSSLVHYSASQTALGAGSTVTAQYGFFAAASLTGAASNYGYFGDISSATGRWNFYAAGTAPNYFSGDVRSNTVVTCAISPTNSSVAATVTASALLGGILTGTPTAAIAYTLPTGTNMDAAFQDLQTNQSFEWSVINLAAATYAITITANTGHTVVGNMAVAANTSGSFLTRKTAANTFITYRTA